MTFRSLLARLPLQIGIISVVIPFSILADTRPYGFADELEEAANEIEALNIQLAQAGDSPSIAVMQTRVQDLEEQIRRLTGRMERLEFEEGKLNTRIDRLVSDIDTRLSALEAKAEEQAVTPPSTPTPLIKPRVTNSSENLPTPRPSQALGICVNCGDRPTLARPGARHDPTRCVVGRPAAK